MMDFTACIRIETLRRQGCGRPLPCTAWARRVLPRVVAVVWCAMVSVTAVAQTTPPAVVAGQSAGGAGDIKPEQFDGPRAPSLGGEFPDAMRTPEAVQAALELLKRSAKAYREAKVFSDEVALTIEVQGRPDGLRFSLARDESGARLESDGMRVILKDGQVYFSNPRSPRKYLAFTADRTITRTLLREFGGFNLPIPSWILEPEESGDPVLALAGSLLPGPKLVGFDAAKSRVYLQGEGLSEATFQFDSATTFVASGRVNMTPVAESGIVITMSLAMKPTTAALAVPISFDKTDKQQVRDLEELQPQALEVGMALPAVGLTGGDGVAFRAEDMRGKVMVLALWADWNQVSMRPLAALDRFATTMRDEGRAVAVMGLCLLYGQNGVDPSVIRGRSFEAWRKLGVGMPLLIADSDEIATTWAVTDLPTTVVVGPDGRIASVHRGMDPQNPAKIVDQVRDTVEKCLKPAGK
jgi:peroxiredoxin